VAVRGEGVLETLHALLQLTYRSLDRRFGLESTWQVSEREFLGQIFAQVDVRGSQLAEAPAR
jgi:hypothetical protein